MTRHAVIARHVEVLYCSVSQAQIGARSDFRPLPHLQHFQLYKPG